MSAARRAPDTTAPTTTEVEAAEKFLADLIARGEVVEVDRTRRPAGRADEQNDAPEGEAKKLPPGVTHEVVHRDGEAAPAVKRRRYSAF